MSAAIGKTTPAAEVSSGTSSTPSTRRKTPPIGLNAKRVISKRYSLKDAKWCVIPTLFVPLDDTRLGSKDSDECMIDSIAQSWAILANTTASATSSERATQALESVEKYLIRHDDALATLFTPPFNKTRHDPGYIKGYPPGLRENGGQYSHAAMWTIFAFAKSGKGDKACDLFSLLNPINHARTLADSERYKVEPYVVAADVYSVPPHVGRGGWTWYTGAAGWMYRAGVDGILGIRREGKSLVIDPCIPSTWPGFAATINVESTRFDVQVNNVSQGNRGITQATLNGASIDCAEGSIRTALDGGTHTLKISI